MCGHVNGIQDIVKFAYIPYFLFGLSAWYGIAECRREDIPMCYDMRSWGALDFNG